ncbi:MAG TPA: choice-of-anchor tandem repeat GloVer-containing protein [Terriglobia bacterium]|nr:choice-of-anchor tandem repeat GloVer-containing protein [Terriglobia bacterium]
MLHSFGASPTDGIYPWAGLARGVNGALFGTTENGGSLNFGTAFEVSAAGKYGVAHNFGGSAYDGSDPGGGVITDAAGNLYGTTTLGGDDNCNQGIGCGIVFHLDKTGAETVLHNFTGIPDGASPWANLLLDAAGNLYGTTDGGGDYGCSYEGGSGGSCGTVFELTSAGEETVVYAFTGGADGGNPYRSGVVMDPKGDLYGTTFQGGTSTPYDCFLDGTTNGCGVVFEVSSAGKETVLHTFTGAPDGGMPLAGLVFSKGALYGTTSSYGANYCGTVFKITP